MKRFILISFAILLVGGFFIGCGLNPVNSDKNAIEDLIDTETAWFKPDGHYGEEGVPPALLNAFEEVYIWFRTRDTTQAINRTISIDILGDSAYVSLSGSMPGIIHIVARQDGDTVIVDKNFTDIWTRTAIFKKDTVSTYHRGWRIYAISGTEITTVNNEIQIDSIKLHLDNSGIDTIITDITTLVKREDVIKVRPDDYAQITIYTNKNDAHAFIHSYFFRWKFHQDSVNHNAYNGTWKTPHNLGVYRVGFDVLSNGTLSDDSLPYDANLWGIHYIVTTQ
jgi:hypothetical protein